MSNKIKLKILMVEVYMKDHQIFLYEFSAESEEQARENFNEYLVSCQKRGFFGTKKLLYPFADIKKIELKYS